MEVKNDNSIFYIGEKKNPDVLIKYTIKNSVLNINSTIVKPELQGQGLASYITKHVLEYARKNKLIVNPVCSYTVNYFLKHKEYEDIKIK